MAIVVSSSSPRRGGPSCFFYDPASTRRPIDICRLASSVMQKTTPDGSDGNFNFVNGSRDIPDIWLQMTYGLCNLAKLRHL
eukprot:3110229-Pyramimonas_sp.AAC.1